MIAGLYRGLYFAAQAWRGEPVVAACRELERTRTWTAGRLAELQQGRVAALLRHAYENVPYYREAWSAVGFARGDWDQPGALARLPALEKSTLQREGARLRVARPGPALEASTSGSSGTPVTVLRSQASWAYAHASVFRAWGWHGVRVGERYAYFWGVPLDPAARRKARWKDALFRRVRCSAFDLDTPRAARFFERMRRSRAAFAMGYPSALTLFARALAEAGLEGSALRWKAAITTAEVLRPEQREVIGRVLGCRVVDSYGCAEAGVAGFECERGGMHVPVEAICVERQDGGDGGPAEVLLTDLHNFAQPLIRYRVGDLAEAGPAACPCGRALPLLGPILGRAGDTLRLPDGRSVNANLPSYVFKHHAREGTVHEYQFVQHADGRVELRVKPGPGFGPHHAEEIRREVTRVLGIEVELRLTDRFERAGRGKHRDFVRLEEAS